MEETKTYWNGNGKHQELYDAQWQELVLINGNAGTVQGEVLRAAARLRDGMKLALRYPSANNMGTELLGPAPAPIVRLNDRYRYRLLWVGKNDHATRELLAYYMKAFYEQKENRGLSLVIDCNAMD